MATDNYAAVLEYAKSEFLKRDPNEMAQRAHLEISADLKEITVPFVYELFTVDCETALVYRLKDKSPANRSESVDILHHLFYCQADARVTGVWAPFRDLKGAGHFNAAFEAMTLPMLIETFSGRLDEFVRAGLSLGGELMKFGEASIKLDIFPLIPITYVMWDADDEFPANANVLFDKACIRSTHPEDIPGMGTLGARKLVSAAEGKQ